VTSLRRTEVGDLEIGQAWTLQQLEAMETSEQRMQCVLDADLMLDAWPSVTLTAELELFLSRGQAIAMSDLPESGWLRIYSKDNLFIGIGEIAEDGKLAPRRLFVD
jgi:tRNA pseudouridine55 synthase